VESLKTRISPSAMSELKDAMKKYADAVQASDLSMSSQATYVDHVNSFIRWLRYDFEPGSRKAPYARKRDKKDTTAA
jgi:hypothetical protein